VKRTKEKKQKTDKEAKLKQLLCLFSFCEKKGQRRRRERKAKKESAPLENKHSSLSLDVETNTPNTAEKKQFSAEKTKKKSQISRHKTDPRRHFILT